MTLRERGRLAVKVLGLAVLAQVVPALPWSVSAFMESLSAPSPAVIASTGLSLLAPIAAGLCLVAYAAPLSQWLLLRDRDGFASPGRETLHTGIVLTGVCFALVFVHAPLVAWGLGVGALLFLLPYAVVVVLLCWPDRVTGIAARFAEKPAGPGSMLGAGLTVIAVYCGVRALFQASATGGSVLAGEGPREFLGYHMQRLVEFGGTLALAGGLLVFSGRLADRLAWRGSSGSGLAWHELGPTVCLELALLASAAYMFCHLLPSLSHWLGGAPGGPHALVYLVVKVGLVAAPAAATFFAARLLARPLAAWLWPGCESQGGRELGPAALVGLEIAVTVVALYWATSSFGTAGARMLAERLDISALRVALGYGIVLRALYPAAACLLLILLRGDAAWLMLGSRRDYPVVSRAERAAAIQPWLVLLGAFFAVTRLSSDAVGLAVLISLRPGWTTPSFVGVMGVAMAVAAGPLSRLLSHGRILPRIWREPGVARDQDGTVA